MSELSTMKVRDWMTKEVATISETRTIGELIEKLDAMKIHGLPVVDGKGQAAGVVSLTDLVKSEAWKMKQNGFYTSSAIWPIMEQDFSDILYRRIGDIMTRSVISCDAETSLEAACHRFVQDGVHRLLVLDGERRVAGILSTMDIIRALISVTAGAEQAAAAPTTSPY